jgi:hypothetical protein
MVAPISNGLIEMEMVVGLERAQSLPSVREKVWLVLSGLCGRENIGGGVVMVAGRVFLWAVLSYAASQAVLPSSSVPFHRVPRIGSPRTLHYLIFNN